MNATVPFGLVDQDIGESESWYNRYCFWDREKQRPVRIGSWLVEKRVSGDPVPHVESSAINRLSFVYKPKDVRQALKKPIAEYKQVEKRRLNAAAGRNQSEGERLAEVVKTLEQKEHQLIMRIEALKKYASEEELLSENQIVKNSKDVETFIGGGIYFLINKKQVVYVGISDQFVTRLKQHISENLKTFSHISTISLDDRTEMVRVEKRYIKKLRPLHNVMHNS